MGRMAELWQELQQETDEWANDPQAQQEYEDYLKAQWGNRYPTEQGELNG